MVDSAASRDVVFRMRAEPVSGAASKARKFGVMIEQIDKRTAATQIGEARKVQAQRDKNAREHLRAIDAARREEERANRDRAREADRLHQRHRQRQLNQAKENRKLREQEIRDHRRVIDAQSRAISQAQGRIAGAHNQLAEGVTSAGESLVRMTTGLATIGLVSEDNSTKLLQSLVVLRGINDSLAGSVTLYLRLGKLVEGYRATLAGVEALQTSIAMKQAILGGGAGARALRRPGLRLAGDVAGGAASGLAEGVAERGIKRSFSRTLIREGSEIVGGAAAGAAGGLAAQTGLSGLQQATLRAVGSLKVLHVAASAAAAPLAILAGGATIFDMLRTGSVTPQPGSIRGSVAGGFGSAMSFSPRLLSKIAPESLLRGIRGFDPSGDFGPAGPIASAELSGRAVARSEANLKDALAKEERRRSMLETQLAVLQLDVQSKLSEVVAKAERFAGRPGIEAIDRAQEHLRFQGHRISQVDTSRDPQQRLQQMQQLLAIAQQMVSLSDKRKNDQIIELQARREIVTKDMESLRLRREAAQEEIRGTKEALDNTRQRIKAIKDRLLGAEVRFAQMDPIEQKRALAIGRKAKANQAAIGKIDASIEAARFRKALLSSAPPAVGDPAETFARSKTLSGLDKTLADLEEKRKQRELSRKERDVLLGIGTPEAERLAKKSAVDATRQTEFGNVFTDQSQKDIFVKEGVAAWQQREVEDKLRNVQGMTVQVEGLKDIALRFDTDENAIRRAVQEGTSREWERVQAIAEETHRAEIAALREANARQNDRRRANAAG